MKINILTTVFVGYLFYVFGYLNKKFYKVNQAN